MSLFSGAKPIVLVLCVAGIVALGVAGYAIWSSSGETEFGVFDKQPPVRLLTPAPNVELLEDLTFYTAAGQAWPVPKEHVSDGASIPRVFWTPVGGPLSGDYRDAAIVHDYYCAHFDRYWDKEYMRDWKAVHRAFYYGMRARGVGETQAKLMYAAVYHFGPRWEWKDGEVRRIGVSRILGGDINPEDEVFDYVENNDPSLEEIESFKPSGRPAANYSPQEWKKPTQ